MREGIWKEERQRRGRGWKKEKEGGARWSRGGKKSGEEGGALSRAAGTSGLCSGGRPLSREKVTTRLKEEGKEVQSFSEGEVAPERRVGGDVRSGRAVAGMKVG